MTKVFQLLDEFGGHTIYGHDLTTNGADIEPGLMVTLDTAGRTVTLATGSGSKPFGFAYGDRYPQVYAPTTRLFNTGEVVNVVVGHGMAAVSSDFFTSGSLPTEAAYRALYAGAGGKLALNGTFVVARLLDIKSWTAPSGGTGTSENVAFIQYDFMDLT